jgi:hypothetical protein
MCAMVQKVTWRQVMAWRTRRHQLHERAPASAEQAVVTALGGLHAQLFSSAERKAAEQEAERLAAFFGDPLELTWAE